MEISELTLRNFAFLCQPATIFYGCFLFFFCFSVGYIFLFHYYLWQIFTYLLICIYGFEGLPSFPHDIATFEKGTFTIFAKCSKKSKVLLNTTSRNTFQSICRLKSQHTIKSSHV